MTYNKHDTFTISNVLGYNFTRFYSQNHTFPKVGDVATIIDINDSPMMQFHVMCFNPDTTIRWEFLFTVEEIQTLTSS